MEAELWDQVALCDNWMKRSKPAAWPSMEVQLMATATIPQFMNAMRTTRGTRPSNSLPQEDEIVYKRVAVTGHWSILEFSWACFFVGGLSRICTHEQVRHRIFSYAQESTRVHMPPLPIVAPDDIPNDEKERYKILGPHGTQIMIAGNTGAWAEALRKRNCLRAAPEIRWMSHLITMCIREFSPLIYACCVPDCSKCDEHGCRL